MSAEITQVVDYTDIASPRHRSCGRRLFPFPKRPTGSTAMFWLQTSFHMTGSN